MSATPVQPRIAAALEPYPAGTILATSCPLVSVLVETSQRRLIATQAIRTGDTLFTLEGRESDIPTRYSIQIGLHEHLDSDDLADDASRVRDRFWMYLNHSCAPSAGIRGREVVALHDIAPGEGVTFDYNTTEWEMASPFDCHCRAPDCVGRVAGYRRLNITQRSRIQPYVSEYLRLA